MDLHTAGLRVEVGSPDRLIPGAPARLGLHIEEAASGDPIRDIVESHERPLHFIVVSTDLEFLFDISIRGQSRTTCTGLT